MNTPTKLIWQCQLCNDTVTSYSNKRHDMNVCKCGQSGVDLESEYQRSFGDIKELNRFEWNGTEWKDVV